MINKFVRITETTTSMAPRTNVNNTMSTTTKSTTIAIVVDMLTAIAVARVLVIVLEGSSGNGSSSNGNSTGNSNIAIGIGLAIGRSLRRTCNTKAWHAFRIVPWGAKSVEEHMYDGTFGLRTISTTYSDA